MASDLDRVAPPREDRIMPNNGGGGLPAFVRSPLVLAGLLLVLVGTAELIVGQRKLTEYRARQAVLAPLPVHDPTALYPAVSAVEEKHAVVEAKLGYYELLTLAGRGLAIIGLASVCIGIVLGLGGRTKIFTPR